MPEKEREKWNCRYRSAGSSATEPSFVLKEYGYLLPNSGKALDLAAGLGANALYLASRGMECSAWDISNVAMERLSAQAAEKGLSIICDAKDAVARPPVAKSFDVIVVSRFLHRPLCPAISAALRPGGMLFYQTFIQDKTEPDFGPSNPDYLLTTNELLRLFHDLTVRVYREEGTVGNPANGFRNEACLIAEKH